jgi:predicted transcriptional regulator
MSSVLATQELAIMKIVWKKGQATVRDVYQELLEQRQIAYTSVMTTMQILEKKGFLTKETAEKAYVYRPVSSQDQWSAAWCRSL